MPGGTPPYEFLNERSVLNGFWRYGTLKADDEGVSHEELLEKAAADVALVAFERGEISNVSDELHIKPMTMAIDSLVRLRGWDKEWHSYPLEC